MSGNSKQLIAFSYFGGKNTYCGEIVSHFPQHIHFADVFGGSLSISLNKPFSEIDTVNDINGNITNFFKVLRDRPNELIPLLILTPVGREEYMNS